MKIEVKIIHAFGVDGEGGNPAGVVLDANGLNAEQKQAVAQKLGLPEIAFVSRSAVAAYKLDFFTPVKQIAHCGHATIAAFSYLKKNGFIQGSYSSKETIDGVREIIFKGQCAYMEQTAPVYQRLNLPQVQKIISSLGILFSDLLPGFRPIIVDTGNRFLIVPLKDRSILGSLKPDFEEIERISAQHSLIGFYPYAIHGDTSLQATARMFAPYYGIMEEAGTGMAAGPLACFLHDFGADARLRYRIEQGRYMERPSRSIINAEMTVKNKTIQKLYVGGDAYVSREVDVFI